LWKVPGDIGPRTVKQDHPFIRKQFGTTAVWVCDILHAAVVYVYVVTKAGGSVVVACTVVVTMLSMEI
jgi:hypothetical protein